MTLLQIAFLIISGITILGAVGAVTARNILRSALSLILSFLGVGALYILLEAPFLAAVQVLIYVGAIAVLILVAIMLTERLMKGGKSTNEQWWVVLILSIILAAILIFLAVGADWPVEKGQITPEPISALGETLLTTYLLPFEVASLLLLMAMIGAIIIAREEK